MTGAKFVLATLYIVILYKHQGVLCDAEPQRTTKVGHQILHI